MLRNIRRSLSKPTSLEKTSFLCSKAKLKKSVNLFKLFKLPEMSKKYTFLFVLIDAVGHVNACLGIAGQLRDRGHKVVFATPNAWKGKLEPEGFIEECYSTIDGSESAPVENQWADMMEKMATFLEMSPQDQIRNLQFPVIAECMKQTKFCEPKMKEIMDRIKPDVVVIDCPFHSPALLSSGVPYVLSISPNPLGISSENVPPPYGGFPTDGDRSLWKAFADNRREVYANLFADFKQWVIDNGGPELKGKDYYPYFLDYSPYANIYMCPLELDYTMFRPNPPNFYQFDAFVRITNETFEIPEKLRNLSGKLIYFSMGTIGCSALAMMKRLIGILAKSPNRFIVSKGPLADQIDLPDNMWGAASVPQTKVIPLVDLVITHGGNNTVTESFYFGKRVLILPLFGDQWDNGQRVYETGLGLQLLPFKMTETDLLSAIESLLNNEMLERRMNSIGQRIRASNSQARAADIVENVPKKYRDMLQKIK